MPIEKNLSNFYVSESFYRLVQLNPNDNKSLVNGIGQYIGDIKITGSLEFGDKLKTVFPDSSQISIYIDQINKRPIIQDETTAFSSSIGVIQQGYGIPTQAPVFGGTAGIGTFYVDINTGDLYYYTFTFESGSNILSFVVGNMVSSSFTLQHNLGYDDIIVSTYESMYPFEELYPSKYLSDSNSVLLDFTPNVPTLNSVSASILNYGSTYNRFLIGDSVNTSFILTHSFNTRELMVLLRESGSQRQIVNSDVAYTALNTVTVNFSYPPNSNEYVATLVPFSSSLGVVYTETIGDATNTIFNISHSLGTRDVFVVVRQSNAPYNSVYPSIYHTNENYIQLEFTSPPTLNEYIVNILG